MKGIWANPAAAAEEAEKGKKRRRRPNQIHRPKQYQPVLSGGSVDGAGIATASNVAFSSLPTMNINGGGEAAGSSMEISRSCPLPSTSVPNMAERRCFDAYWPDEAVEEAIKKGDAFQAKYRVNAHNKMEAYCTIDGVPTDVLINGETAQNRAIEGDIVAIMLDPVASWTKFKGSYGPNVPAEVRDVIGNKSGNQQVNANCENHLCSNGPLPLDTVCRYHVNGDLSELLPCDPVNEPGTPQSWSKEHQSTYPESSSSGCTSQQGEDSIALKKICAMMSSYPSKRPTGRILSIIKKSPRRDAVIGFLNSQRLKRNNSSVALSGKEYMQLIPTDPKFPVMVVAISTLPDTVKERLNNGDITIERELVAAQIDDWSDESPYPQAHVIHILGRGGEIEPQIAAIMFENAICAANFSPESLDCLPDIPWDIPVEEFETRKDLRNICIFTIDPSSAIDLDDALSVESVSDEVFRIGIHIADVSYFVRHNTALDTEAQIQSTSVYILQHNLSMLPPKLSEEMCSLLPGVDRLAFSVILDITRSGDVIDRWIGRSIIRSCCKMSYDFVQDIIDGSDSGSARPQLHGLFEWKNVIKDLASLHEISKRLRESRFKDGALTLENAKRVFLFDENGTPYHIFLDDKKDSCSIVEEFMLLANKSVAEIISKVFPDCALLCRHPEPNLRKLKEFEAFCSKHGFELDTSSSGQLHLSLCKIREKLKDDAVLFDILVSYASRTMQAATYFCTGDLRGREDDWGHYALSVPFYTHFTSPLRRYPDIIVHRILTAALDAEEMYQKKGVETSGRCFTGLLFNKDAAESEEGREAISAAALKHRVPGSEVLAEVSAYCNERRLATRQAEESGEKAYLWAMLKKKMVIISEARVLGLGPRFMSVYINKLAMERRIYYADVGGMTADWLEATCTLVLDLLGNKPFRSCGNNPSRFRPIEEAVMVVNPSEVTVAEEESEGKGEISPAFFPLVLQQFSAVPVALYAIGGDDGPLDIGARLYMCSFFR